jgi:predicted Holliday junction resolvase-like endonuclease
MDLYLNMCRFFLIIIFIIILYYIIYIIYIIYLKNKIKEQQNAVQENCKLTRWGCCNDKLTTRLNSNGTNCRGF